MVNLFESFSQLRSQPIMVLGDFLCDRYTKGLAQRISPEAPVIVLNGLEEQRLAGGAGNVVFNLQALNAEVFPVGLLGEDSEGRLLRELFQQAHIHVEGLIHSSQVQTIVKHRFLSDSQQLLRVDYETPYQLSSELEDKIIDLITEKMPFFAVIAISDYQKGFLTPRILSHTIQQARQLGLPVIVDPKGKDFNKYRGATLIKPNFQEACTAAKMTVKDPIEQVAQALLELNVSDAFLITRSEKGMAYFAQGQSSFFPVKVKEVVDVTGAGDTALAMICLAYANKIPIAPMAELANIASSIAIEKVGCAHVSLKDVARRIVEFTAPSKALPAVGVEVLRSLIGHHPYHFYLIDAYEQLSFGFLENLKNTLAYEPTFKKVIYCDKEAHHPLLMQILASFDTVDFIIKDQDGLRQLMASSPPAATYHLKDGVGIVATV